MTVIGTSSLAYTVDERWYFTGATILVSWFWFFGLAFSGRVIGEFDQEGNRITLLNKISALIIWGTAVYIAVLYISIY